MKVVSVLVWPQHKDGGPCLGWADGCENSSEDTHHSPLAAKSVCETLIFKGFGCDRQIFPIEARVEIDDKVVWRWTKEKGWRDVECADPSIFEEKSMAERMLSMMQERPTPKEFVIKIKPSINIARFYDKIDHPNSKKFSPKKSQRQTRKTARRNKK